MLNTETGLRRVRILKKTAVPSLFQFPIDEKEKSHCVQKTQSVETIGILNEMKDNVRKRFTNFLKHFNFN